MINKMNHRRVAVTVLASVGMAGTFLPWAGIGMFGIAGTAGDGWITLGAFVGALLIAVLGKRAEPLPAGMRACIALLCIVAAAVGLHDASKMSANGASSVIGPGLYLVCAVSVALGLVVSFGGRWWQASIAVALIAGTVAAGELHVVYGDDTGIAVCRKGTWSLVDTFVDSSDYVNGPILGVSKTRLATAHDLIDCRLILAPPGMDTWGSECSAGGEAGVCVETAWCNGPSQSGLCPGRNTICCAPRLQSANHY